jgi:hypothetical protein
MNLKIDRSLLELPLNIYVHCKGRQLKVIITLLALSAPCYRRMIHQDRHYCAYRT